MGLDDVMGRYYRVLDNLYFPHIASSWTWYGFFTRRLPVCLMEKKKGLPVACECLFSISCYLHGAKLPGQVVYSDFISYTYVNGPGWSR